MASLVRIAMQLMSKRLRIGIGRIMGDRATRTDGSRHLATAFCISPDPDADRRILLIGAQAPVLRSKAFARLFGTLIGAGDRDVFDVRLSDAEIVFAPGKMKLPFFDENAQFGKYLFFICRINYQEAFALRKECYQIKDRIWFLNRLIYGKGGRSFFAAYEQSTCDQRKEKDSDRVPKD